MNDTEPRFLPIPALERASRPLVQICAILLIGTSVWGLVNQLTIWNRPVELIFGTPEAVLEDRDDFFPSYRLLFSIQETGEKRTLELRNNGPVLNYFASHLPEGMIALRIWSDDQMVFEVHPLIYDVAPIRDRVPPSSILTGVSLLGLALGLALLFPGTLERMIYRLGRHSRRR